MKNTTNAIWYSSLFLLLVYFFRVYSAFNLKAQVFLTLVQLKLWPKLTHRGFWNLADLF